MAGFTKEEIFLNKLGKDSFLNFWSWPSLFRDQGNACGKRDGKEICDLTVIFGNNILLFSDKRIDFNRDKELSVAWSRWARKAIGDSIKQIKGARRWLSKYPTRVYTDIKCKKQIPITIPSKENIEFHNIVVCHGVEDILLEYNHEASFMIDNSIQGDSHWDKESCMPFCIGKISEGSFVHIFNESTIALVLKEFNTTNDFILYLKQREHLINSEKLVRARSEADIMQLYYENYSEESGNRTILSDELKKLDSIFIDKGGVVMLYSNPSFIAKKNEDEISYFWDNLIESFSYHILNGSVENENWNTVSEVEPSLRYLAETGRFERRILATAFIEFYNKTLPGQRGTRLCLEPINKNKAYLFLILPFNKNFGSHQKYREVRRGMLQDYCLINKFLNPRIEYIVGIACKAREDGHSIDASFFSEGQDFVFMDVENWEERDKFEAKHIHDEYVENGLLVNRSLIMETITEFPEQSTGFRKEINVDGNGGNQPCICGSGKPFKKCCGKL